MDMLADYLRDRGKDVVTTREPGGSPLGEAIRTILLDTRFEPDGLTELFLLEASRHDHVEQRIRPALERGAVVLSDRFADSSTVYQGLVRGLDERVVLDLNRLAVGGIEPVRTFVFDMDPGEALSRALDRNSAEGDADRLDEEPLEFHRKIRRAFVRLAQENPERIRIIDASGTREDVFDRLLENLDGVFDE